MKLSYLALFLAASISLPLLLPHKHATSLTRKPESAATFEEKDEMDWKDAQEFYNEVRTFPGKDFPVERYVQGANLRDSMARANLFIGQEFRPATTPTWQFIGPTNTAVPGQLYFGLTPYSGRLDAVAYDPTNPGTYYVGGGRCGLWKTTNSGASFVCLSDNWSFNAVSSIAVDPTNGYVYVGTGDAVDYGKFGCQSLLRSTDGGSTWAPLNSSNTNPISSIIIDPDDHNVITFCTVGVNSVAAIWRTTNGGANWQQCKQGSFRQTMACSAASGGIRYYYASMYQHLYRSSDRGATWSELVTPFTYGDLSVACSQINRDTVYVVDLNQKLIEMSTDAGSTWTSINGNFPTDSFSWSYSGYSQEIGTSVNAGSDVIYVGTTDVFQSVNGGTTWTRLGNVNSGLGVIHTDQHALAVNPANANEILVTNDGGLYRGTFDPNSGATSFANLNATLGTMELYKLDIHPTNANTVITGAQDGGSPASLNGNLSSWKGTGYGDGSFAAINPANPANQYNSSQYLQIMRTDDSWAHSMGVAPISGDIFGSEWAAFIAPFVLDPSNPDILYAASQHLNRYNRVTSTWEKNLGNFNMAPDWDLLSIAVAPSDPNRIYVGGHGVLWMSEDRGGAWRSIVQGSTPLPSSSYLSINVNPNNPDDVLVGVGNSYISPLYRCTNVRSSDSSRVWQDVGGLGTTALPKVALGGIVRDPDNFDSVWYVATDLGVFVTYDAGTTWANMTQPNGLPNVGCNDLRMRRSDRMLYVATMGRGVWRIQLPTLSSVANLSITPSAVLAGTTTTGTVTLHSPAGSSGKTVYLYTSNANIATVPATVVVPSGATSQTFSIQVLDTGQALSDVKISAKSSMGAQRVFIHPYRANNAQFVSQSVPTTMTAGQTYAVSFTFQNTGSSTWNTAGGYKLAIVPDGSTTWSATRIPIKSGTNAGPGASAIFSGNVYAPLVPGSYMMQFQPMQQYVGTFGASSASVAVNVVQKTDAARFLFQRAPQQVLAGQTFDYAVAFNNVGTSTWDSTLGYASISRDPLGNSAWGASSFLVQNEHRVDGTSAPGATAIGWASLTAPINPGLYTIRFSMANAGVPFGDLPPKATINVVPGDYNSQFIGQTVPTNVTAGSQFTASITMKNIGTQTWTTSMYLYSIGSSNFGLQQINCPGTVVSGDSVTFNGTFTAPGTPGQYKFQFSMARPYVQFGQQTAPVTITVS